MPPWGGGGVLGAVAVSALVLVAACSGFKPADSPSPESLYGASVREFRAGRFTRALQGFSRVTVEVGAVDTLLPLARFYLAECYFGMRDFVTATREFRRVADEYPTFRLGPAALLRAGDAYAELWKRPELDPTYGETARATWQELIGRYPDSEAAAQAGLRLRALVQRFATKEYQNGMFYLRRGAYDSAIIYFRSLIASYPSASLVPEAFIRLVQSYRAIGYREEEVETCAHLRQYYGTRADVREVCGDGRLRR